MTQPSEQPRTYARWVERVAQALHDDCELEWQAVAVVDPSRAITMHMVDAHYGMAHDLVRRLGLAAAPDPPPRPSHWMPCGQAHPSNSHKEWLSRIEQRTPDPVASPCPECGDAVVGPHYHRDTSDGTEVVRLVATPAPLDGAAVVGLLHNVGNTLWGWIRRLDGYDDAALARAIDFVLRHPDLKERLAAARLEGEAK